MTISSPLPERMSSTSDLRVRGSALSLAVAGGVDYGFQLVVPLLLVRFLDPTVFGQYRLLWLLAGTALAVAPAFMPQALFYFLPRATPENKRFLIGNVIVYLAIAACVVGIVSTGWNPLLPVVAEQLFFQTYSVSTIFIALWVIASLLDVLPTAEGRAHWQAGAIISLAILRTLLLAGAAFISGDIFLLSCAMLAVAAVKISLLVYYLNQRHEATSYQFAGVQKQLAYCFPFAVGNALFLLRIQADQWVVASMLVPAQYAVFSIAAAVLPLAALIRQPLINATMPDLNRLHALGDHNKVSQLIAKTNGTIALFLLPISGALFAVAPELVDIVYTRQYSDSAPIMRLYLVGMMMMTFAMGHVLPALGLGRFAALNSTFCLLLSVVFSLVGLKLFGMPGAALGSVMTLCLGEFLSVKVVSQALGAGMGNLLAWHILRIPLLSTSFAIFSTLILGDIVTANSVPMLLGKCLVYTVSFSACYVLCGQYQQKRYLPGVSS
jgi:O-antigen/teichoic acid export membrane protein